MDLYTQWEDNAPTARLQELSWRVPSQYQTVSSDERLKCIVEKVVSFWATSINFTIPIQPTAGSPDIALFRYMTRVVSLSKNAPNTVSPERDFREFVLWHLRDFARVIVPIKDGQLLASLAFGVSHSTFVYKLGQFLACNKLETLIQNDPVLSSFVDCSYDVAVEAFQCPISS